MARYVSQSDETQLKCRVCDVIFRHEESTRLDEHQCYDKEFEEYGWMWESPCCKRQYRIIGNDSDKPCALITYGAIRAHDHGLNWAWAEK